MKTAGEWYNERPENNCDGDNEYAEDCERCYIERLGEWIEAIQRDALAEGMRMAAGITKVYNNSTDTWGRRLLDRKADEILAAAEELTKKKL